jgi:hypothetical protein
MAILIINEMTDITGKVSSLNDMGLRRFLSISAS